MNIKGEYNDNITYDVTDEVMSYVNGIFLDKIKNVPHDKEYLLLHKHIAKLIDREIDYSPVTPIYIDITTKFIKKFVKGLEVDYSLKRKEYNKLPDAYANINCDGLYDSINDYISSVYY